ncbi:unnamed protein product [Brassicogethes aeneus]|uniref:Thioredoxin domain-containing protein n=1 Tax=Brassicogethes aeneus TaxID=1431903 RepID=A0A9P0FGY8_BRAAE|nr:unnamed protein product [Brassicogethes aeneus]
MVTRIKTDVEFQTKVLEDLSDDILILSFLSLNCGICKMMIPKIERFVDDQFNARGKVQVFTIYIEEFSHIAEEYEVRDVPYFVYLKNRVIVNTYVGNKLESFIKVFEETKRTARERKNKKITNRKVSFHAAVQSIPSILGDTESAEYAPDDKNQDNATKNDEAGSSKKS